MTPELTTPSPWFAPLPQEAVRAEAWQTLRVGTPLVALVFAIEAVSHVDAMPKETPLFITPLIASAGLAGMALWVRRGPYPTVDPTMLLLVPWAVILGSIVQHVHGAATGSTLFLGATLMGVATFYVRPLPLVVAGTFTVGVLAWASYETFDRAPWVYPAIVIPMAGLVSLSRRRALVDSEHRRQAERAAALERARAESLQRTSTLAAGMAHHFNNLLAVIAGNGELLREDPALSSREELQDVLEATKRASSLVNVMLALVSAPVGERGEPIALSTLCHQALQGLPSARVDLVLAEGLPPLVGRPGHLTQALGELLENALEADPEGRVRVEAKATHDALTLSIEDQGPGIAASDLPHVVDPFFTDKGPARSGLGLSLARAVVLAHGGHFRIDSEPGRGTRVVLSLPTAPAGPEDGRRAYPSGQN